MTTIMGILNVTPDSFSDGGKFDTVQTAQKHIRMMLSQGADWIDVGAESTRPGSQFISAQEEIERLKPVLECIEHEFVQLKFSVDTWKAPVAQFALEKGAQAINCLNGWQWDAQLLDVLAASECKIVLFHASDTPDKMQQTLTPSTDMVRQVRDFFTQMLSQASAKGIALNRFILDPGIGFGKTLEQNLALITSIEDYRVENLPVMIGLSRKGHLGEILRRQLKLEKAPGALERVEAGLAEMALAVQAGASWVRTHDVAAAKRFFSVFDYVRTHA